MQCFVQFETTVISELYPAPVPWAIWLWNTRESTERQELKYSTLNWRVTTSGNIITIFLFNCGSSFWRWRVFYLWSVLVHTTIDHPLENETLGVTINPITSSYTITGPVSSDKFSSLNMQILQVNPGFCGLYANKVP